MNQLPAYLQNLPVSGLAARAAEGIGGSLPPHISIRGNQFTMVDAVGAKQTAQTTFLDVCIADISDVMCKMYYGDENGPKKWTPDSDDPPACWSANGVAPSVEAMSPQSPRCDTCEWNKRGSAQSMEGKPTKACRDEKRMALLVAGVSFPLQFTLTPGSFTNFRAYTEMFKGKPIDMCHVWTRLAFEQGVNGILTFTVSPIGYIDQQTAETYTKMKTLKAYDVLVGRNDRPRLTTGSGTLVGAQIQAGGTGEAPLLARPDLTGTSVTQNQPQGFQPAPFGQASGTSTATNQMPGSATPSSPSSPEQPTRRRRRTAEQIAIDNAAATPPATGFAQQTAQVQQAPFAQGPAPVGQFGIATDAPPPPAGLNDALDKLFQGQA